MNDSNLNKQNNNAAISETDNLKKLTFTEGDRGNVPIARDDDGKICLIDSKSKNIRMVKAGEAWSCKFVKISENVIIVDPIDLLITREQTEMEFKMRAEELKAKLENKC